MDGQGWGRQPTVLNRITEEGWIMYLRANRSIFDYHMVVLSNIWAAVTSITFISSFNVFWETYVEFLSCFLNFCCSLILLSWKTFILTAFLIVIKFCSAFFLLIPYDIDTSPSLEAFSSSKITNNSGHCGHHLLTTTI